MKRLIRALVLAPLLLVVSGCSRSPVVFLINNTTATLWVVAAEGDGDAQTSERLGAWFFGLVRIGDRTAREAMFHNVSVQPRLSVRLNRCTYEYRFPTLETSHNHTTVVQLEPDRKIYLIAEDALYPDSVYRQPVGTIPPQREGFPLQAVAPDCD